MRLLLLAVITLMSTTLLAHNLGSKFKLESNLMGSIQAVDYHKTIQELSHMGIEIAGVDYDQKIIDILISNSDFKRLTSMGFNVELNWVNGLSSVFLDDEYFSPSEIESAVKKYHADYPEITKLVSIGKSVEGRDIWALKISDYPNMRELDEPTTLFNSMHHAREVMTPEISMDIIDYLLKNYGNDSQATNWVNTFEIWVVPMLNVDGNNKVWEGSNMWRKNTRGGYGVDLNRNYPFNWDSCNGSSSSKRSDTYRGPEPASEPETKALMGLVEKIKPVFDISYHSYSRLVLYPFGCRGEHTGTASVVTKVGKELGELLNYKAGTPWELLYSADGGDIDWMYGEHQVIPFVIELNSRMQGFQPNYSTTRDKTVEKNRKGWMHLLNRLGGPGVRGNLKDIDPNQDYFIEVYYDAGQLFQSYKVNPDGTFHIVLNPGQYELRFKGISEKNRVVEIKEELVRLGTL